MPDWNEIWKNEKYPMWTKNGDLADYWNKGAEKRFQRLLKKKDIAEKQAEEFKLKRTDVVLDIGCGTGRLTLPIAERANFVYAIDISKEMLEIAKREAKKASLKNIEFINGNFETFNTEKIGKVDVSISYNSLGVYDIKNVLEKINDMTKKEVFIFIFASKGEWLDEPIAEIIYGKRINNIPSSAEIIYNLLKEMGIKPDFTVKHNVWKSEYESINSAVEDIMKSYKIESTLKCDIKRLAVQNSAYRAGKYILSRYRNVAEIHWKIKNNLELINI